MERPCGLVLIVALLGCDPVEAPRAGLDWSVAVVPTAAPPVSPLALTVTGTRLYSTDGASVRLRGVNVCSLEFDAEGAIWGLKPSGSSLLGTLADPARWKVNVVRVPVNQQWFLEDEAYAARVESIVDDAARRGVYAVIDVQWERGERTEPYDLNILEVPTFGAGNSTEAFWHAATSRWANRTNLLFDLINEPHGRPPDEIAAAMQVLIDAIRTRTQDAVLIIGGPDWAHSVEPWRQRPLRGPNLMYSVHQYLPHDSPADFEEKWGRAAKELPVIVGEFLGDELHADYARQVVEAAEAAGAVGWMPWAIGCGLHVEDDTEREPARYLAAEMRALN